MHRNRLKATGTEMKARILCCTFVLSCCASLIAQTQSQKSDIDPLALQVLKTVTDPMFQAKAYSFRALVSHETMGSNGQVVTLFHVSSVTLEKPNKIHLTFLGVGKAVELYYNAGQTTLYAPDAKLYTTVPSPATIDAALDGLEKKDIFIPIRNFLASDPYKSLTDDLRSAYVVGRVKLFDQDVHQLAFTEPNAEWQLWVVGGDTPRVVRLEVIDKSKPEKPRTIVQFSDWDFSPNISATTFTFTKPADAKQIDMMPDTGK
jgi:hypothetical protein